VEKPKFSQNEIQRFKLVIKCAMWQEVGIIRSEQSLKTALTKIYAVLKKLDYEPTTREEIEIRNMAQVAKLIIQAALNRKESAGAHFRSDYCGG